ncbi:selenide, water dikinase SelD [Thiolapillus brandeum]|uniref:Selenide, water dikinase n=1 Tax=Thiolapillus brandeum TaxID=1076588 RepID=A0A7U6GJ67_9GAMM|nr:selenide, water dikinase SelD [Thiolapillus brandeum]BAO44673.1 selenide water dikinase [Thiolapillus brandeum]
MDNIRLTEYSHGSGCGCKIAPKLLDEILQGQVHMLPDPRLLVGNQTRDDAAVYDLGDGRSVVSTTDFFMPIVDDPFEFGRIAATNAISDIYAMGGTPLMAIAIFGWPIDKLSAEVGQQVVDGGRQTCKDAGIPLAGGHSIDSPEPIFGLAVTGIVDNAHLKRNDQATPGCRLYLTKPIGIGILTTAQKQKKLAPEHRRIAPDTMCQLNSIGAELAALPGVTAMTDVTGFGLAGHLLEICHGSNVSARVEFDSVPLLPHVQDYLAKGCSPGGAQRNFDSYGEHIAPMNERQKQILCDPQTSGGLLVAVDAEGEKDFLQVIQAAGMDLAPLGSLHPHDSGYRIGIV